MPMTSSIPTLAIRGSTEAESFVTEPVPPPEIADGEWTSFREELVRAVRRVCPPWLVSQSEDFVQAGLLRILEIQRRHRQRRVFSKSYLWMVAHSAVIDEIRRRRRRQEVALDEQSAGDDPSSDRPGPERNVAGREVDEAIRECLASLLESRRTAVLLHIHGHSVTEIAERMGWNLKRAKNLVYRGLSDLRVRLAERGIRHERR